jgi:hypothetical protein
MLHHNRPPSRLGRGHGIDRSGDRSRARLERPVGGEDLGEALLGLWGRRERDGLRVLSAFEQADQHLGATSQSVIDLVIQVARDAEIDEQSQQRQDEQQCRGDRNREPHTDRQGPANRGSRARKRSEREGPANRAHCARKR